MSLETKGTIKYDPDVKPSDPQYMIEAKQLGICVEGGGDIDQMVDELTERIRREISEEFGIPRCDVALTKYTMTCTFDVSAPVNCTLEEFGVEPTREDVLKLERKIKAYAERTGQDPKAVLDKLQAEAGTRQQAVLQGAADMVNAGALDTPGCTVRATTHKAPKKGKGVPE
jgi:hypothetical protein